MPRQSPESATGLDRAGFFRRHWPKLLGISALVLIPCFWHREIVSADLGSHLYNAWLAQLIRHGQAPGLWIAPQKTNVLFDLLLSGFGSVFGLQAAERIAVSLAVLIFFWGIFALVSAATRRAPWFLLPGIATVAYGWTFHMGFFNFYLSLGLAFFSLAIFWRGRGWERLAAAPVAALAVVAHPLGFIWLLGAVAYVGIAKIAPLRRYQVLLFAAAAASVFAVHYYLWRHYNVYAGTKPFALYNGADQLDLFGPRYHIPEFALLAFALIALALDIVGRRHEPGLWKAYAIPLQLYILAEISVVLLPGGVHFPPPTATVARLTERLTSVSAVLACCLLGAMRPSKWHLAGTAAIAAVFFSFVYQDTAVVNKMEDRVAQLVSTLPPNQRVMATILPLPGWRIPIQHIVDRACIGRCFSYGNYEPGAAIFRVRALPGNSYVLSDYEFDIQMERGKYKVQPADLPVYQVYQCSGSGTDLCIRSLEAGEENDRLGVHPQE
ncbi:MAG: hypothetical protein LAN36_13445 [Acidobacteriia bacterium]|nr:hypothetical protein [Terriglobia bacterium]